MGCGCGGGRRNTNSRRSAAITPRQNQTQLRPAAPTVSGLSSSPRPTDRQELERKKRIQISLRKKNNPQG